MFEKCTLDTLHASLCSHWRAARLGNKCWPVKALRCDWCAVSASFSQQKSISLTSRSCTHTHTHTHPLRLSLGSLCCPQTKVRTQREAANFLDRQLPSAQSPNICFNLLRFAATCLKRQHRDSPNPLSLCCISPYWILMLLESLMTHTLRNINLFNLTKWDSAQT